MIYLIFFVNLLAALYSDSFLLNFYAFHENALEITFYKCKRKVLGFCTVDVALFLYFDFH